MKGYRCLFGCQQSTGQVNALDASLSGSPTFCQYLQPAS
jgi:hypothetical protein